MFIICSFVALKPMPSLTLCPSSWYNFQMTIFWNMIKFHGKGITVEESPSWKTSSNRGGIP